MGADEFASLVGDEWDRVPGTYREKVENVAILVEDEPSVDVREAENLEGEETLLGLYQGIPLTARGEGYGTNGTLPDTITLYRLPTLTEARELALEGRTEPFSELVRGIVRETIWHEIGHYFGWDEDAIGHREADGTNEYKAK